MNATLINRTRSYQFEVELDGVKYKVTMHLNDKDKFLDEEIQHAESGEHLEFEGTEGEIREKIVDFLDDNWSTLVDK